MVDDTSGAAGARVVRLIGVYDADGTLWGEVSYWVGARLGRAHCALCDITHSSVRERSDWRACRSELPVPFDTYHRNDQPEAVRAAVDGRLPIVVAETTEGIVELAGPEALERCAGRPEHLVRAIIAATAERGLGWT